VQCHFTKQPPEKERKREYVCVCEESVHNDDNDDDDDDDDDDDGVEHTCSSCISCSLVGIRAVMCWRSCTGGFQPGGGTILQMPYFSASSRMLHRSYDRV
jgi:hypothetical protein